MLGNDFPLDGLVGRLIEFKLRNFHNSLVTLANAFKYSLALGSSKK